MTSEFYLVLKLQEGVCRNMHAETIPVYGFVGEEGCLFRIPCRSVDGELFEADVVPIHVGQ